MSVTHKQIILKHFQRLHKIVDTNDPDSVGRYTNKQAVREQLARMTLVFRDYTARRDRGEFAHAESDEDGEVESMVADVVDASFFVSGRQGGFEQSVVGANALLMGREHEIAILMQELDAGNVDDVIELWHAPPTLSNVVPDAQKSASEDVGAGVDFNKVLCRARSEDDLLYHRGGRVPKVKNRPKYQRHLSQRSSESSVKWAWPPTPREAASNISKLRLKTDISDLDLVEEEHEWPGCAVA